MKRNLKIIICVLAAAFLMIPLASSMVSAKQPNITVKINGKLTSPDFPGDTLMMEILVKGSDASLVGGGSAHGIKCHATFFFNDLTGSMSGGTITLSGTIGGVNEATEMGVHGFFQIWLGTPVTITVDLSSNTVEFIIGGVYIFDGLAQIVL